MWVVRTWDLGDVTAYGELKCSTLAEAEAHAKELVTNGGWVGEDEGVLMYLPLAQVKEVSVFKEKDDGCIDEESGEVWFPGQGRAARAALDSWTTSGEGGVKSGGSVKSGTRKVQPNTGKRVKAVKGAKGKS